MFWEHIDILNYPNGILFVATIWSTYYGQALVLDSDKVYFSDIVVTT